MRARLLRSAFLAPLLAAALLLGGCPPAIGDGCSSSINCSLNNDRSCDTTVRGGLCTVFGCEDGTCPDGATCVRFLPDPSRLAFTACMKPCDGDGACRQAAGFRCFGPEDPELRGLAEIVDSTPRRLRFCVATEGAED